MEQPYCSNCGYKFDEGEEAIKTSLGEYICTSLDCILATLEAELVTIGEENEEEDASKEDEEMEKLARMYISFGHDDSVSFITFKDRAELIADQIAEGIKGDRVKIPGAQEDSDLVMISGIQGDALYPTGQTTHVCINPEFVQYFIIADEEPQTSLIELLNKYHVVCIQFG